VGETWLKLSLRERGSGLLKMSNHLSVTIAQRQVFRVVQNVIHQQFEMPLIATIVEGIYRDCASKVGCAP
jgi:hypothetical protein